MHKRSGYILVLSLTITFLAMFLVLSTVYQGSSFGPQAKLAIERQQAYVLAQSGIQLGISQIFAPKVSKKEQAKQEQKASKEDQIKDALTVVLPYLNRWQEYQLRESVEGIDGTIKLCIMCENGKIDLNAFYDFEKHEFIDKEMSTKMFKDLFEKIEKQTGAKELFSSFEKIIKARNYRFNDATELLNKAFATFYNTLFYDPTKPEKLYLTDIFTVWTGKRSVNPWLFSQSMITLLGLKAEQAADVTERKKRVAQWLKPFKLNAKWQSDWDKILKPLYGKDFNSIPKGLQPLLSDTFEAHVFSIVSYATVGRITQRLLAIVEAPLAGQSDTIAIKKVYWL